MLFKLTQIDDAAVKAANTIVDALEKRQISPYITLAKAALWVVAIVLVVVLMVSLHRFAHANYDGRGWYFDSQAAGVVVHSAQGLMALALAVLGLHQYRGSRILHVLRHLKDDKEPPQ